MAIKPTEGARAPRQMPSVGRKPKGLRAVKAVAGGELLYSQPEKVINNMAWEIVKAYFLIIAILLGGAALVVFVIIGFFGVIAEWKRILLYIAISVIFILLTFAVIRFIFWI